MKNLLERYEQIKAVQEGQPKDILETTNFNVDWNVIRSIVPRCDPTLFPKQKRQLAQIQREYVANEKHDRKQMLKRKRT